MVFSIQRYVVLESTVVGLTVREQQAPDEVWRMSALESEGHPTPAGGAIEVPVSELYEGRHCLSEGGDERVTATAGEHHAQPGHLLRLEPAPPDSASHLPS